MGSLGAGDAPPPAGGSPARPRGAARAKNLLIDLDDPRFGHKAVHEALEDVYALGIVPQRYHFAPEAILGWSDAVFGGYASSEVAAGGVWIFERDGNPIGLSSYDVRGLPLHWLRNWSTKNGIATLGPFGLATPQADGAAAIERALLHATLASVRERGYRQALVPAVDEEDRVAFYEREAGARFVESVDRGRRGRRFRATVLASGNGSNFEAVTRLAAAGELPLEITRLIVNRPSAFALERAASLGVERTVVPWDRKNEAREDYDARVLDAVAATEPDVVLMLGWMHVLPATFVARFPQSINLHPAFLPLDPAADRVTMPDGSSIPAFRGAHAVDDALAFAASEGVRWFGASVHRVGVAVDRGRVLARIPLPLDPASPRERIDAALREAETQALTAGLRRWSYEMP